jgi:hypothetical protein
MHKTKRERKKSKYQEKLVSRVCLGRRIPPHQNQHEKKQGRCQASSEQDGKGFHSQQRGPGGRASNRGKAAASNSIPLMHGAVISTCCWACCIQAKIQDRPRRVSEGGPAQWRQASAGASRQSPTHISGQQQQGGHLIMDATKATVTYTPERERGVYRNGGRRKVSPHI